MDPATTSLVVAAEVVSLLHAVAQVVLNLLHVVPHVLNLKFNSLTLLYMANLQLLKLKEALTSKSPKNHTSISRLSLYCCLRNLHWTAYLELFTISLTFYKSESKNTF